MREEFPPSMDKQSPPRHQERKVLIRRRRVVVKAALGSLSTERSSKARKVSCTLKRGDPLRGLRGDEEGHARLGEGIL